MIPLKRQLLRTRIGTILEDILTLIRSNTLDTDSLNLIYDQAVIYIRSRYSGIPSLNLHTIIRDAMNIDTTEEPWTTIGRSSYAFHDRFTSTPPAHVPLTNRYNSFNDGYNELEARKTYQSCHPTKTTCP